jgi:hypothetical protein
VGLAKNTGKTVTLTVLLRELAAAGVRVGVTSVGRDGEEHDVIDFRIDKPRVHLVPSSLVATTDELLRASGVRNEPLERTGVRTPLGEVLIARVMSSGAIEVAGPSVAADTLAVAEAMLAHGAEQVLIDGAIDRRAASSPDVADGLVISTGAVLSDDIEEVLARTRDAVELVRLPRVEEQEDARLHGLGGGDALIDEHGEQLALPSRFALTAGAQEIEAMLSQRPHAHRLLVAGALPEHFVGELTRALRKQRRSLTIVIADSTKAFLSAHGPGWYERQGVRIEVLAPISLRALTVNPVAPQSHSFDSARLCELLRAAIPDVPVFDVLGAEYLHSRAAAPA